MRLLLDTNVYSALARNHPGAIHFVRRAERILLSTVTVGELLAGFRKGSRYSRNLEELERFIAAPRVEVVPVTWTTADRYSRLWAALRARGAPIPTNDLWIAAHALEMGADLLTFDAHFDRVEGLAVLRPAE